VTEDTGVENPGPVTQGKGEQHFLELASEVAELILEICTIDPEKMYE
jgi:predicted RNase H-like HicB family nuclease